MVIILVHLKVDMLGGGGSGAGSINIFYKTNSSTQTSSITATGGEGGTGGSFKGSWGCSVKGGNGGNGSVTLKQIQ